jgi:hypothetical protein
LSALTVALLASASSGCPKKAEVTEPTGTPGLTRPGRASLLAPQRVSGQWQWSHREQDQSVRRVEKEIWNLELDRDTVRGHYDRVVTFLSLDGVPFECSQSLSYRLRTRYHLIGTADSLHFTVAERDYEVAPSPCERGFRRLGEYKGKLVDGTLVLEWQDGEQTLVRAEAQSGAPVAAKLTVAGPWRWRNRSTSKAGREIRVEAEEWELSENADGTLTGTVLRTVTVFEPKGAVFECSGDTYYQYSDRYKVMGTRDGTRLLLTEVEVVPDEHPCVVLTARHLDEARGRIGHDFLQLDLRGRHKQVLHRPGPGPAAQPNPDWAEDERR